MDNERRQPLLAEWDRQDEEAVERMIGEGCQCDPEDSWWMREACRNLPD